MLLLLYWLSISKGSLAGLSHYADQGFQNSILHQYSSDI